MTEVACLPDGRAIERYTLTNGRGLSADIMTYGATLLALRMPDRCGAVANIVLGFDTIESYLAGTPYFGATVGRTANRIAGARFELDGREYRLAANEGRNHLHGGSIGFDKVLWRARALPDGAAFSYVSGDGEEGYPGELSVEATYRFAGDNGLAIEYRATTSKPTHVNLTHHSYFNLSGDARRPVDDHLLAIDAAYFTPVDDELIPTGELKPVAGTPFDFRAPRRIGERVGEDDPQLRIGAGYDHNFALNKPAAGALTRAARLWHPQSGRAMTLWTTAPGLQLYTGNRLGEEETRGFAARAGLCLEPQSFPNAPNEARFPSTLLRPGDEYRWRSLYVFAASGEPPVGAGAGGA